MCGCYRKETCLCAGEEDLARDIDLDQGGTVENLAQDQGIDVDAALDQRKGLGHQSVAPAAKTGEGQGHAAVTGADRGQSLGREGAGLGPEVGRGADLKKEDLGQRIRSPEAAPQDALGRGVTVIVTAVVTVKKSTVKLLRLKLLLQRKSAK